MTQHLCHQYKEALRLGCRGFAKPDILPLDERVSDMTLKDMETALELIGFDLSQIKLKYGRAGSVGIKRFRKSFDL